jgi:hypothetical protein
MDEHKKEYRKMKLYEMTIEQYDKWCRSLQGVAFDYELTAYIEDVRTPKEMYDAILFAKSMFEREVDLDGRTD